MGRETTTIDILLDLTRLLLGTTSLDEALKAVSDAAMGLLPCEHASIRIFDESRRDLLAGARSGQGALHPPMQFQTGEGIIGWVAKHCESARVHDTLEDPRFKKGDDQGFQIRSLVAVPLLSAGQIVGVLGVTSSRPRAFSARDQALTMLLANCAVPAIDKARLERLAMTDPTTMAYSQRYLPVRLEEETERSRRHGSPLSLMLLDLDRFKSVNDEHGHAVGDRVLRGVADRIRRCVRGTDVLVRRGGDEFVVLMPHTDGGQAMVVAERLVAAMASEPFVADELRVARTVSIGVSTWDGAAPPEELERQADEAMYEAKRAGGGRALSARIASP